MATQTASAPKGVPADVRQHIEKVASCLRSAVVVKDDPRPCTTLNERMTQLHVPGVSVAVIHNGSIEWERGPSTVRLAIDEYARLKPSRLRHSPPADPEWMVLSLDDPRSRALLRRFLGIGADEAEP